ncbi:alpha/beta hydrolase domain-containing protein [Amycolatopsis sp. RTGN1]|uniref:alpha/beta hydrolase domain-containing protein n=1 Tax=Amycolatopsis ponsaeliensis TaxID=2992142 RepID=UPI0025519565|nr:alpha/beta hydrolase domain-containing protein [Amycolatopsis sp. RTGN1]
MRLKRGLSAAAGVILATALSYSPPTAAWAVSLPAPHALASTASPKVSGPVTGGLGAIVLPGTTTFDLGRVGYTQSEYFVTGTANAYKPTAPFGSDGTWQVAPTTMAPYTTRLVTYRPADATRFNGTVVIEWLNVSGSADAAPEWMASHTELIRNGFAWVGVSAQSAGVTSDKVLDPLRYLPLSHPGDSYSYDIFSQAGKAVRDSAAQVLGGLRPVKVLAEGESQSAFRLTTYINAVQPLSRVYDGFLVHSRGGGSAALSQSPQDDVPTPAIVHFRRDVGAPVLVVETESDLITLGYLADRQDDSPAIRLWELAGTAHADHYIGDLGPADDGSGTTDAQEFAAMLDPPTTTGRGLITCTSPINTGEQHYVLNSAQYWLNRWVATGETPPRAPRLQVDTSTSPASFVLDDNGNVKGGVRTPSVEVPVASLSGLGQAGDGFCFLFGTTTPFNAAKLDAMYPHHATFITKWALATIDATRAGFIRPADTGKLIAAANASTVGS